jgi:hypothetical protein
MCDDIKNWLIYVGLKPERADMVYTWLYEARKVTTVTKRQRFLADLRGNEPHGGPGYGIEYTGNMATYVGGSNCADSDGKCRELGSRSTGCQVNFEYGSARWYKRCRGLNVLDSSEFVPFEEPSLEYVYNEISTELQVTVQVPGGARLEGGRYYPLDRNAATPIARDFLRRLLTVPLPDTLKCGITAVGPVSVVWMVNRGYVPERDGVRTDVRSYFTELKSDGSIISFCNLPNVRPSGAGVYISGVGVSYPRNPLAAAIRTADFRARALAAALGARGTARPRTIFSAGVGAGGESSGLLLAGAAVAASAAAFLLLKK